MSTAFAPARSAPVYGPGDALSDTRVMIARGLRRSVRDPEAFITALALPVILMLLFVYVFGGAFNAGVGTAGGYVNYVVPGLIVLCAGFGAGTTAVAVATDMSSGIVDRFRSMPIASASVLAGHIVASLVRNLLATALVIAVGLAVGWRPVGEPARLGRRARHDRGVHPGHVLAGRLLRPGGAQPGGGLGRHLRADVRPVPEQCLRPGGHHGRGPAADRGQPAVHAGDRDHARAVDGPYLDGCRRRPRGVARGDLLRGHPRRGRVRGQLALQAPHGGPVARPPAPRPPGTPHPPTPHPLPS